ncbi:hypothetical protein [Bacillus toyonensis]|uniref:hypothetical protein n=1 Tax=Bacillus toyonensis TaxID=155322 RepID=UPI002E1DF30C|nr:hypothetical protein [Bacillus toyonensis]
MNYLTYKIPNKKKWLLTDAFLHTFKEELDKVFEVNEKDFSPTYWNTYNYLESTSGFYKALKIASEKHNVQKAIYEYAVRLPWYDSDMFDGELTILMYERNIITEGSIEDIGPDYTGKELEQMEQSGEIKWTETIRRYKNYCVKTKDWHFVD